MTKEYLFNLQDYSAATWGQSESYSCCTLARLVSGVCG